MLSIIVKAYKGRDVATADIVGVYLKAYMKDFVLMKFTGETVQVLCKMNPKHKPFVVIENNQQVLYVRLIKAIYSCVKSALLWYKLFSTTLQEMGFIALETHTTNVWQTAKSTANNAPLVGTWTTLKSCTKTPQWSH